MAWCFVIREFVDKISVNEKVVPIAQRLANDGQRSECRSYAYAHAPVVVGVSR